MCVCVWECLNVFHCMLALPSNFTLQLFTGCLVTSLYSYLKVMLNVTHCAEYRVEHFINMGVLSEPSTGPFNVYYKFIAWFIIRHAVRPKTWLISLWWVHVIMYICEYWACVYRVLTVCVHENVFFCMYTICVWLCSTRHTYAWRNTVSISLSLSLSNYRIILKKSDCAK